MRTFEDIRADTAPAHARLIDGLLSKGLTFSGTGTKEGEVCIEVKSVDDEIVISPSGKVELFTDNLNPYEPYDTGYHVWNVAPDEDDREVDLVISWITRITGDD